MNLRQEGAAILVGLGAGLVSSPDWIGFAVVIGAFATMCAFLVIGLLQDAVERRRQLAEYREGAL